MVLDSSGTDVTTAMAGIIDYTANSDNWHFTIDNSAGTLVADDVYIVALAGLYVNPLDGSTSATFNT